MYTKSCRTQVGGWYKKASRSGQNRNLKATNQIKMNSIPHDSVESIHRRPGRWVASHAISENILSILCVHFVECVWVIVVWWIALASKQPGAYKAATYTCCTHHTQVYAQDILIVRCADELYY